MKNQIIKKNKFRNCHRCGVAMEDLTRKFCDKCLKKMNDGASPKVILGI